MYQYLHSLRTLAVLAFVAVFISCDTTKKIQPAGDDGILEFQILQMNDVYEISPSPSDNSGGLARVAAIRKELLAKNPNTFTVLAGDFISPSVLGTLKTDGKRIRGKHMVEVLNTLGLDWVVFGNHEFDYDDLADLQARLDESTFTWFAANARLKGQTWTQQFFKNKPGGGTKICPDNQVISLKDADGTSIQLGLFGVLINSGRKPWVTYTDWQEAAQKNFQELQPKCDVVIALTHLAIEDDRKLAAMLPQIPLIMGGHEHDNMRVPVGPSVITKADANAKTVYVHTLRYDKRKKSCTVSSELRKVNGSIPEEPATAAVVAKWERIKNESLSSSGFTADAVVTKLEKPLDCRESVIRHGQAPVGAMITEAMMAVSRNKPELAVLNSGSIRVDDVLTGILVELDIVRMLPFGGGLSEVEMKGSLLRKTLDAGANNQGNGGYLQINQASMNAGTGKWMIGKNPLEDNKLYRVVLPDFLLTGNESNMGFLKTTIGPDGKSDNPDIPKVLRPDAKDKSDLRNDIRLALIKYLRGE
ncbi:MAG: bifunctional metallophosphatase/5'-nucleotidase [Saprospiraceae bacterium]|nr:bifunctional metallophosphatase/5'-nucleotidase [Saprospiraceae bacterium]